MTTLAGLKLLLKERGLHLNKKLGQHLLIDSNIRRKIIEMADLSPTDYVIEIGAGMGYMTEEIIKYAKDVIAIEIDRGFAGYLRESFSDRKNLTIIHEDILKTDLETICNKAKAKGYRIKIMGNLPYNINAPILAKIAEIQEPIDFCCFVVQKEVADRYTSKPGNKDYSAITIYLQYRYRLNKAFTIPKDCFFPKPDVESAAIGLTPHPAPPVEVEDENLFFSMVRTAFSQRRKMISNSLKQMKGFEKRADIITKALICANINPNERPENLPIESFAYLANALSKK